MSSYIPKVVAESWGRRFSCFIPDCSNTVDSSEGWRLQDV